MKMRLKKVESEMIRVLEYTELLPIDTKMKKIIKADLLEYLKSILKKIEALSVFLDNLNNCSTEEEVEALIMKNSKIEKTKNDTGLG